MLSQNNTNVFISGGFFFFSLFTLCFSLSLGEERKIYKVKNFFLGIFLFFKITFNFTFKYLYYEYPQRIADTIALCTQEYSTIQIEPLHEVEYEYEYSSKKRIFFQKMIMIFSVRLRMYITAHSHTYISGGYFFLFLFFKDELLFLFLPQTGILVTFSQSIYRCPSGYGFYKRSCTTYSL